MPQSQESSLNKQALNSLTELYYAFVNLVEHMQTSPESKEELDIFYLRGLGNVGGLKAAIEGNFEAANLNPEEAGVPGEPLTLERLLPQGTISRYTNRNTLEQIQLARADLKIYNDAHKAHVAGMDDVTLGVVDKAKEMLRKRQLREGSVAEDTRVDIRTAHVAHQNHTLMIGHVRMRLQSNSIMDLAVNYVVNEARKGSSTDSRSVADWVSNHTDYIGRPTNAHGIKDALRDVNELVKEKIETVEELFDLSTRNAVVRNF